jgi:hypothetical protein
MPNIHRYPQSSRSSMVHVPHHGIKVVIILNLLVQELIRTLVALVAGYRAIGRGKLPPEPSTSFRPVRHSLLAF